MNLHKDTKSFEKVISDINQTLNIAHGLIEKDYFVTMFLERLTKKLPTMIFKGGTSLSKCYHVIKRFSEDIDITVERTQKLTQGQYRKIKQAIVDSASELELEILNLENTRSRQDFNQYKIDYPTMFERIGIKQYLFAETSVSVRSFPTEMKAIKSIIQEFLEERGQHDVAEQFGLHEFLVRTQKLDRTLIDKLFALGDYYLVNKTPKHSRHVYDIYKLLPIVAIDDAFRALVKEVREARKVSNICRSAHDGADMQKLLEEIVEKDAYKNDYVEMESILMYEPVPYSEAKKALIKIINKNIF